MSTIVSPDAVEFTDANAKSNENEKSTPSWITTNLEILSKNTMYLARSFVRDNEGVKLASMLMPKYMNAKRHNDSIHLQYETFAFSLVEEFLLKQHGPALEDTGIMPALSKSDKDNPSVYKDNPSVLVYPLQLVKRYFPEYKGIETIFEKKAVSCMENPWEGIYMIPHTQYTSRAFFAGLYERLGAKIQNKELEKMVPYPKPATLRDAITYAKELGVVPQLARFMEDYAVIQ